MNLSIVIPSYNEADRIGDSLKVILEFCRSELDEWEIIVVDDGSSDGTSAVAASQGRVQCLRNAKNMGKGYSVRRGMLAAIHDPVLFTDADLSTPIAEALALCEALHSADIAIASRKAVPQKTVSRKPHRKLMALVFRSLVKIIALRGVHDTQCGFKMFRRAAVQEVFPLQTVERWGFDVELLYIARKTQLRIVEVPVQWNEADSSRLGAAAPMTMVVDLLRVRWNDLCGRYRAKSLRK